LIKQQKNLSHRTPRFKIVCSGDERDQTRKVEDMNSITYPWNPQMVEVFFNDETPVKKANASERFIRMNHHARWKMVEDCKVQSIQ
jgi:hypothetical protein